MLPNNILSQFRKLGLSFLSALSFISLVSLILLFSTAHFILSATSAIALPVFPGAQGFGTETSGGRGGTVYKVTNLNDSGPGSLRDAVQASGPRVVIFEVSGTIQLNNTLKITNPFITIAGQTAPSPGITLKRQSLNIVNTHDVLIQHIRFRVGDERGGDLDAVALLYGNGENRNIVIDHCSISWGIDENISSYGTNNGTTIQWCIISEGLHDSVHSEGPHSKGMRIGKEGPHRVSIHHNLFAHNDERNPRLTFDTEAEVINNVMYNWGNFATRIAGAANETPKANFIGNYYKSGSNSSINRKEIILENNYVKIYVSGNVGPNRPSSSAGDDWNIVSGNTNSRSLIPVIVETGIITSTAEEAYDLVLSNVGARPADRDSVDIHIINDVRNGTGRIINSQNEVGGWPVLAQNSRPLTLPSNYNGDDDGNGYTNLEEWLHNFADEVENSSIASSDDAIPPSTPNNLIATAISSSQINLSWSASTDDVGVTGYRIYRDEIQITTTANTTYQDTGLNSLTTYMYNVSAIDAAGNESGQSNLANATTQDYVSFSQFIEAENMNLISPMTIGSDNNASGGQYISPTSGTNLTSPIPEATLSLTVPETGTYYLWVRMMGPDTSSDALYTGIDTIWDRVYPSTSNAYEWVKIETIHNTGNYKFNLTQGIHTLQIGHGEINARADALFLTNDPNNIPTAYDTIPPAPPQGLRFIVQ